MRWRAIAFGLPACVACHLFQDPVSPERPLEVPVASPAGGAPPVETPPPSNPDVMPSEPAIQPSGGPTRGKLARPAVERAVTAHMPAFRACYEAGLERTPNLSGGTVMVNFVVAPDGTVPYAAALEKGTDLNDDAVIDCVLDEFQKLEFEAPQGGRAVSTYPLQFAREPAPPTP
ncbi:MAG TPA: AgmX/PglI C-terminal domain-containing protein [Polyangiaceae bacterium]